MGPPGRALQEQDTPTAPHTAGISRHSAADPMALLPCCRLALTSRIALTQDACAADQRRWWNSSPQAAGGNRLYPRFCDCPPSVSGAGRFSQAGITSMCGTHRSRPWRSMAWWVLPTLTLRAATRPNPIVAHDPVDCSTRHRPVGPGPLALLSGAHSPSRRCLHRRWWALTPPFHPSPAPPGVPGGTGRSAFCCGCSQ